ncbi:MAG: hypothetical protein ACKPKO_16675, partial [Candidatus Fonsibacter sp.]
MSTVFHFPIQVTIESRIMLFMQPMFSRVATTASQHALLAICLDTSITRGIEQVEQLCPHCPV